MKRKSNATLEQNLPSWRDIQTACREIQSGWSDKERRKRAGLPKHEPWNPPLILGYELGGAMEFDRESA